MAGNGAEECRAQVRTVRGDNRDRPPARLRAMLRRSCCRHSLALARVDFNPSVPARPCCAQASRLQASADTARRLPKWVVFDTKEDPMGKYFIAWLLGVPAVVLVVAYLFFH